MTHEEVAHLIRMINTGIEILAVFVVETEPETMPGDLSHLMTMKKSLAIVKKRLADRWAAEFDGMEENPYITRRGDV